MRTESVYLDAVSADGMTAFVVRLQRNVGLGSAWVWVHAFVDGEVIGTVDEEVPCDDAVTEDGTYRVADDRALFDRTGTGRDMRGRLTVAQGRVAVDATFAPTLLTGDDGLLAGRTERHGTVTATISIDGDDHPLDALGQWHEQHQDTPRFTVPFTYLTARGRDRSIVGLISPRGSGALLGGPAGPTRADSMTIDPPGPVRPLVAGSVTGELRATYTYPLSIRGRDRQSSIVVGELDGHPVSGCVNDWTPP